MNEDVVEQEGDVVGGGVWAGRDVREGGGMGEGVGGGGCQGGENILGINKLTHVLE